MYNFTLPIRSQKFRKSEISLDTGKQRIQFGKQHSRYKAILPSIVLRQQCCEVYFISPAVVNQ